MTYKGNDSFLISKGVPLVESGFPIVPIARGKKFPLGLSDWQNTTATVQDVATWSKGKFRDGGVGILTGDVIAVDIDLFNEELVEQMVRWCVDNIGYAPMRIGKRPKSLLVYRSDQPFSKCISNAYRDKFDQLNRIEVLGSGQQFVAYAIHPDTDEPYTWVDGDELVDTSPEQLAVITLDHVEAMFGYFTLLVDEDWKQVGDESIGRVVEYESHTVPGVTRAVLNEKESDDAGQNDGPDNRHTVRSGDHSTDSSVSPINKGTTTPVTKQQEFDISQTKQVGPLNISTEKVVNTLSMIDPEESYELWVKVGMAVFHQFNGSDEGFDVWDEWSSHGESYKPREMLKKWRSFEADTRTAPITFASIVKIARTRERDSNDNSVEHFLQRFVYVIDGDRVCDLELPANCSVMKIAEFRNLTANKLHLVPAPTEKDPGKEKLDAIHKAWMTHPKRLDVRGTKFEPNKGQVVTDSNGVKYINEYHVPKWERTTDTNSDGFAIIMDHFSYQLEDDEERTWLIDWFAHLVQKPEQRCLVTPLLVATAHGTGRGWFGSLLRKLLGSWNVSQAKFRDLTGENNQFNGFLHNTLVCEIGEVRESGRDKFQINDKVRDILTEKELRVNQKYGQDQTQPVYTRFFMQSNHVDALALEEEDRRIQVLTGPMEPQPNSYYDRLYKVLDDRTALSQFYWWLSRRNITEFNHQRSSHTEGRKRMIASADNELQMLFKQIVNEVNPIAVTQEIVLQAANNLGGYSEFNSPFNKDQVTRLIKEKYSSLQSLVGGTGQIKFDGKPVRPWIRFGITGEKSKFSNEEVRKSLQAVLDYSEQSLLLPT